jgi:hypothetical protein
LRRLLWCALLGLALPPASGAPSVWTDPSSDPLARAVARAQARADGVGGPLLHAFIDPRCAACQLLMERLRPLIAAGELRVRWIPVQALSREQPAAEPVQANTALLALLSGSVATPTLAYRTKDGTLRIHVGTPVDLESLLRDAR